MKKFHEMCHSLLSEEVLNELAEDLSDVSSDDDFSYYTGPDESVIFLEDEMNVADLRRKMEEGEHYKTVYIATRRDAVNYGYPNESGHKFYVFYQKNDFAKPALIPK